MPSNYPNSLDNLAIKQIGRTPLTGDHAQHHDDLADAVNKIQAELGINPSSSYIDVTTRLAAIANPVAQNSARLLAQLATPNATPLNVLSTDLPTVTAGTSATISGQNISPNSGRYRFYGAKGSGYWSTTFNRASSNGPAVLDFYYTGSALEIQLFTQTTNAFFWIFVDGKPITSTADTTTLGTTTASTSYWVKLAWGSPGTRRIEFFADFVLYRAIETSIGDTVSAPPVKPVCAWIGDSFFGGATGAYSSIQSSAMIANRNLGLGMLMDGLGGTGYVSAGSFTPFWSGTRAAIVSYASPVGTPSLFVFQGSVNDDASNATVQAAATAAFTSINTAFPNVPIIVFGPQPSAATATISANRALNAAAVKAAAIAAPNVIGFHDEVGTASGTVPGAWSGATTYALGDRVTYRGSVWESQVAGNLNLNPVTGVSWKLVTYALFGTGQVGTTAGDGPRDTGVFSDAIHPTVSSSLQYAALIEAEIRADLWNAAAGLTMRIN